MKRQVMAALAIALVWLVAGAPVQAARTFKYGHANAVTYPYHLAGLAFDKKLQELTGGELKVQIYPLGQLGGERDITEGLQLGTVDFQATSIGVTGTFIPELNVFNLPFLFKGPDHFLAVMNGPIGQKMLELIKARGERVGLVVLGIAGPSFRVPMNNVRPLEKVEDFRGLQIRTMEVPLHMAAYKALGASPVPIPFGELYTALQTGVVDGNENGPATLHAMKFYEVQRYVSTLPIVSNAGIFLMSKRTWDGLDARYKNAVLQAAADWVKTMNDECLKQDRAALSAMAAAGVKITEVTDYTPFIRAVQPVYDDYLPKLPADLQQVVRDILAMP